jgi:putative 4-mercaptohistidine N1-methyltranferase
MQIDDKAYRCRFDWDENHLGIETYPLLVVQRVLSHIERYPKRRALDVGCGVGRSSFELARQFDEVVGVDTSSLVILGAQRLKESGVLSYTSFEEGEIAVKKEIRLNKFGLEHASKKVNFWQMDLHTLNPVFCDFDLIMLHRTIESVPAPADLLKMLMERLSPHGLLTVISSYGWREEITPKDAWLGGRGSVDSPQKGLDALKDVLYPMQLLAVEEIPCVEQFDDRHSRYALTQMSIWYRK